MDKREIASLVEKSRQGDNAAFGELYRLTEKQAYFIALRIAKNEDDAYDILQDCYIKAMQKMDTLENPENFVAWFNQIVSNAAKNYVIKSKPMLFRDDDDEAAVMDLQVDDSLDCKPDDSLDTTETREFIRELIDELPEDKKLCVLMHYFQNMSVVQIAEELGISEGTVKTRLYHSRDKIKQSIEALEKKGVKVRGIAPIPFFVWMLRRMAEGTQISQTAATVIIEAATSSAAGATAAATATATTATTAASATAGTTVTAGTTAATAAAGVTATGTATATGAAVATGVTAKVVAIAVAGTVAVGVGATAAKVVHDRRAEETATMQTEESTEFASENIAVIATQGNTETTIEFEGSTLTVSTKNGTTSVTVTTPLNTKSTTKPTTQKATEVSSTAQSTSATTKAETTTKPTTTQQTTTEKPTTTAKATTTATTKPTTTAATTALTTTEATTVGTATVTVNVYSAGSGSEYKTYTLTFDAGVALSGADIESALMSQHGIDAMADDFSATTQAGGNYTATAYEI